MAEENNNQNTGTTEGTEGSTTQEGNQTQNQNAGNQNQSSSGDTVKTYTQAEIDAMIEKRLARERKKYEQQQGTQTGTEGAQAQPPVPTQINVDVTEDARQQANAIIAQANQRLIQAIAQSEATKLSINPDYVADAVRLADLSKVKVNEDGTVDTKSITTALEAVIERMPVLKAQTEAPAGGFKIGGQGGNSNSGNGWTNNQNSGDHKRWNRNNH